ncbi:uncharacterized protein LOC144790913 [Lissotriton helveticus]
MWHSQTTGTRPDPRHLGFERDQWKTNRYDIMYGTKRKMSLISKVKNYFKTDKPIKSREGVLVPAPNTPASFMMFDRGYNTCVWLENWVKYTKDDGVLAFPLDGTFNGRILFNLRTRMNELHPRPRLTQYEALEEWEIEAFERERPRMDKGLTKWYPRQKQESRDKRMKQWRQSMIVEGLFPMMPACHNTGAGEKSTEKCKHWGALGDSDDELIDDICTRSPPPYNEGTRPSSVGDVPRRHFLKEEDRSLGLGGGGQVLPYPEKPELTETRDIYPKVPASQEEKYSRTKTFFPRPLYESEEKPSNSGLPFVQPPYREERRSFNTGTLFPKPNYGGGPSETHPTAPSFTPPLTPQILHDTTLRRVLVEKEQEALARQRTEIIQKISQINTSPEALTIPVTIGPVVPLYGNSQGNPITPVMTPVIATPRQEPIIIDDQSSECESEVAFLELPNKQTVKGTQQRYNPFNTKEIKLETATGTRNVSLVTPDEIESWSRELEKQTPQTKPLDLYKLRVEIEELMAGNVGLDRLNTYSEEELSFICKSFTRNTRVLHEKLTETAVSMGVDISKSKPLQKPYRADFSDKDIEHLNVAGKKLQIKELMGVLQKWGDVEKWRSRWAKKREEVQR